jgi:hypothetical protein
MISVQYREYAKFGESLKNQSRDIPLKIQELNCKLLKTTFK